jgi:fibronectin-binding autotransporter adhesin
MTSRSIVQHTSMIATLLIASACGSGQLDVGFPTGNTAGGGGGGAPTTYAGTIADSLKSGIISVTVSPSLTALGSITFIGGAPISLTGTLNGTANTLAVTGGGYTLSGSTSAGSLTGTYSGPGGTGDFVATSDSVTTLSHRTYCGRYTSTNGNGFFNAVITSDGAISGIAMETTGSAGSATFTGNVTGTTLVGISSQAVSITGTITTDLTTITGSYAPLAGSVAGTGTFSSSTGSC